MREQQIGPCLKRRITWGDIMRIHLPEISGKKTEADAAFSSSLGLSREALDPGGGGDLPCLNAPSRPQ